MEKIMCPNCGGEAQYYHSPGITYVVCKKKCQSYKIIKEIIRNQNGKTNTKN